MARQFIVFKKPKYTPRKVGRALNDGYGSYFNVKQATDPVSRRRVEVEEEMATKVWFGFKRVTSDDKIKHNVIFEQYPETIKIEVRSRDYHNAGDIFVTSGTKYTIAKVDIMDRKYSYLFLHEVGGQDSVR